MKRTAQDLLTELQYVLGIDIRTGQIVLNVHQSHLESFETKTFARLKPRDRGNGVEVVKEIAHTTGH